MPSSSSSSASYIGQLHRYNCKLSSSLVSLSKLSVGVFAASGSKSRTQIDRDYSLQKCNSFLFVTSQMFLIQFRMTLFLCGKQHEQYPPHHNLYSIKMWCIIVFGIPDAPSISCTIIHHLLSNNVDTIAIEVLSIMVEGQPVPVSSSVNLPPS